MALAVNDVIQVSLRGTLFGQRIINVLHYVVNQTTLGITQLQLDDIAVSIATDTGSVAIVGQLLATVSNAYTIDAVRAQRVSPARTIYSEALPNLPGLLAGQPNTANIACSLTKRGANAGRTGQGRFQLAGLPAAAWIAGTLDVGTFGPNLSTFRDTLVASYNPANFAMVLAPCIFNPTLAPPHFQVINSIIIKETARTMHRRTLFLGE